MRRVISIMLVGLVMLLPVTYAYAYGISFNNPLVNAADRGEERRVISLLKEGYPVDSEGDFGSTPLMRAAYRGHTRIAHLLIKLGADVNKIDKGGATPLHLAARSGEPKAVSLLLGNGAYIDAVDNEAWTPLMKAVAGKHREVIKVLVDAGADVSKVNEADESVLVQATAIGIPDIVKILMGSKSYATLPSEQQETALEKAQSQGKPEIVNLLQKHPPQQGTIEKTMAEEEDEDEEIVLPLAVVETPEEKPDKKQAASRIPSVDTDSLGTGTVNSTDHTFSQAESAFLAMTPPHMEQPPVTPVEEEKVMDREEEERAESREGIPRDTPGEQVFFPEEKPAKKEVMGEDTPSIEDRAEVSPPVVKEEPLPLSAPPEITQYERAPTVEKPAVVSSRQHVKKEEARAPIPKAFQELGRSLSSTYAKASVDKGEGYVPVPRSSESEGGSTRNPEKRRPQLLKGEGYIAYKEKKVDAKAIEDASYSPIIISDITEGKGQESTKPQVMQKEQPVLPAEEKGQKVAGVKEQAPSPVLEGDGKKLSWLAHVDDAGQEETIAMEDAPFTQNPEVFSEADDHALIMEKDQNQDGRIYLLQLGTFINEEQATYVWKQLQVENTDVLAALGSDIFQAVLGVDKNKVYRLRAGSVVGKERATASCQKLRDRNIECFVVETDHLAKDAPVQIVDKGEEVENNQVYMASLEAAAFHSQDRKKDASLTEQVAKDKEVAGEKVAQPAPGPSFSEQEMDMFPSIYAITSPEEKVASEKEKDTPLPVIDDDVIEQKESYAPALPVDAVEELSIPPLVDTEKKRELMPPLPPVPSSLKPVTEEAKKNSATATQKFSAPPSLVPEPGKTLSPAPTSRVTVPSSDAVPSSMPQGNAPIPLPSIEASRMPSNMIREPKREQGQGTPFSSPYTQGNEAGYGASPVPSPAGEKEGWQPRYDTLLSDPKEENAVHRSAPVPPQGEKIVEGLPWLMTKHPAPAAGSEASHTYAEKSGEMETPPPFYPSYPSAAVQENRAPVAPPAVPMASSVPPQEEIAPEVVENLRQKFFAEQGMAAPPTTGQDRFSDFYKELEHLPKQDLPVSEAVPVSREEYINSPSYPDYVPSPVSARPQLPTGYWLRIGEFSDEATAEDYWLRMFKYNEDTAHVTMIPEKASTPFAGNETIAIKVGPIQKEQEQALCAMVKTSGYRCKMMLLGGGGPSSPDVATKGLPPTMPPPTIPSAPVAGNVENKAEVKGESPSPAGEDDKKQGPSPVLSSYWARLGSFNNMMEAEYYWMFVQDDHPDITQGLRYDLVGEDASKEEDDEEEGENGSVFLQVGSFSTSQQAGQQCIRFNQRNIACVVVP